MEQQKPHLPTWLVIVITAIITAFVTVILFGLLPALFGYHVVFEPQ